MHAGFNNPRLFEAEAGGIILKDGQLKLGCQYLTLIKEINLPVISADQVMAYGILCSNKGVYEKEKWRQYMDTWKKEWMSGTPIHIPCATAACTSFCRNLDLISVANKAMEIGKTI